MQRPGPFAASAAMFCLLLVFSLAGCTVRPAESEDIRALTPQEAVDVSGTFSKLDHSRADNDNRHTILALSSGGADGAFGAGVLAGWAKNGSRPEFDVVTGVSTGSLLAVFTFLGPQHDPLVRELYTSQTNERIFRKRGLNGLLSDSLYDNSPLKEQIEEHVTEQLLADVAKEHEKGRRLYIATTNLDAGELVVWDIGKIALSNRANPVQFFQKVLRASAAVPGYFQPVYIKPRTGVQLRQAHVDGGVKEPVLYMSFMAKSQLRQKELYMIINGTTRRFNASQPVEAKLASITRKTISELIRELQRDTIFRHYVRSTNDGVDFHLTSIPDFIPIAQDALDFNPKRMRELYQAGYDIGLQGTKKWRRKPPSVSRETMDTAINLYQ